MIEYQLLHLASLVTFTFGAMTFAVMVWAYWRKASEVKLRFSAFTFFTGACAAAFLLNVVLSLWAVMEIETAYVTGLTFALAIVTALLPPSLFLVIYAVEAPELKNRTLWSVFVAGFYGVSILGAVADELTDVELDYLPAAALMVTATAGLIVQVLSRRELSQIELRYRRWTRVVLIVLLLFAVAILLDSNPLLSLAPDY